MLACELQKAAPCRYDRDMEAMLEAAPIAETTWDAQQWHGDVRLQYKSQQHFEQLAVAFGMMAEWRDGVPRAAYHGVVSSLDRAPPMRSMPVNSWCYAHLSWWYHS